MELNQKQTEQLAAAAYNTMVQYAEVDPLELTETWEEMIMEMMDVVECGRGFAYDDLVRIGSLLNPNVATDDSEFGKFAWAFDFSCDNFGVTNLVAA